MRIELLSSIWIQGEIAKAGEVIDASPSDAKALIQSGKAKVASVCEVKKEAKKKSTPKSKKTSTPVEEESTNDS